MASKIFHVSSDRSLQTLVASEFPKEADLQKLLEEHPDLIDGEAVDPDEPRRWILIDREIAIAENEGSPGRWSIDHLFVDQDAILTLVEVKRSSDTRIRREVLGQMFDYVSHAMVTWTAEELRRLFEARCIRKDLDPARELLGFLGGDPGSETADEAIAAFWSSVAKNLELQRVRLLFVTDELPRELRRSIEFLNEHMAKVEVLGLELRHFTDGASRVLVPRVVGQTERARSQRRAAPGGPPWNEARLLESIERRSGPDACEVARRIIELSAATATYYWWSPSATNNGGVIPVYKQGDDEHFPYQLWSSGTVEFRFTYERKRPPFSDPALRSEWLSRLSKLPGLSAKSGIDGLPSIRVERLLDETTWLAFVETLRWWEETIGNEPKREE
jgi:hypothetical protein